jgi:arylsulfatase A-like enzyme
LDLAGAEIPADFQGKSLKPFLENKTPDDWRTSFYYQYFEYPHGWHRVKKHYGVRTKTHKLIHFYDDIDAWELFDLKADPNELNNVFGQEKYATVQNELERELSRLKKEMKVPEDDEVLKQ